MVPAAYYWKSDFLGDKGVQQVIDSAGFRSVYLKFFEVDWNARRREALPLDRQRVEYAWPDSGTAYEVIPTVFITNRAIAHTDSAQIGQLADKISKKLRTMLDKVGSGSARLLSADSLDVLLKRRERLARTYQVRHDYEEGYSISTYRKGLAVGRVQIDCDWTATTRARYFALLRALKRQLSPCELSVTVRLYPFKYPQKMGVPPVDRGMLMCYNIRPFDKLEEQSSILDLATAQQYLEGARPYPLPLDVALPVFSWGILFRGNTFKGIVSHLTSKEIARLGYFRRQGERTYLSTADTSFHAFFLRQGDVLRLEQPTCAELEAVAELTRPLTTPRSRVALFSLDTTLFSQYSHDQLTEVYRRYR